MLKFITKTVCIALIGMLCVGNLNAQTIKKAKVVPTTEFSTRLAHNVSTRGVIYSEGFESTTGTSLPAGWAKSSGINWITIATGQSFQNVQDVFEAYAGTRSMGRSWINSGNNWAWSAGIGLTAGVQYIVSFYYSAPGYESEHDNFEVKIGDAQTIAGMTTMIFSNVNTDVHEWTLATCTPFTPTTTGTYYIGFHDLTPAGEGIWIAIDELKVTSNLSPCPAVTNVTASIVEENKIKVDWVAPANTTNLTEYKIYQNDVEKATVPAGTTTWTSGALADGYYTHAVSAIYSEGCEPTSVPSNSIQIGICAPATLTSVTAENNCNKITWEFPAKGIIDVTLTHSGDPGTGVIGSEGSLNFGCFHRFDTEDLAAAGVIGGTLNQVVFQPAYGDSQSEPHHTYKIRVYKGGTWTPTRTPGELVAEVALDNEELDWGSPNYIDLPTPINIDATKELWIGYYCTATAPNGFPALVDVTPYKEGKGNVMNYQGWKTLHEVIATQNNNWYIQGIVKVDKKTVNLYHNGTLLKPNLMETSFSHCNLTAEENCYTVEMNCEGGGVSDMSNEICLTACKPITGGTGTIEECKTATLTWTAPAAATAYKVYKGIQLVATVTEPTYTEEDEFEHGKSYRWDIKTVCEGTETTSVAIIVKADCVGISELSNNVTIHPNPATSTVTITGADIAKVEIYNMVGQMIEVKEGFVTTVDVSSYNNGLYLFKVYDANNNSITKRIMVSK